MRVPVRCVNDWCWLKLHGAGMAKHMKGWKGRREEVVAEVLPCPNCGSPVKRVR